MANFPQDTANILALAETMIRGFKDNHNVFPSPPIAADDLEALLDAAVAACDDQTTAQAAAKAATERKHTAVGNLSTAMKDDIVYAEYTAATPADLGLIGWGPKAEPTPLAVPGQPADLRIPQQSEDSVQLSWHKPGSGGRPAFYRIELRTVDPVGAWTLKETVTKTKAELTGFTGFARGTSLEFRVIAENDAGRGTASNTVTAVL